MLATEWATIRSSIRVASLAYAFSLWVEGSTQLRDSITFEGEGETRGNGVQIRRGEVKGALRRVVEWLKRRGRPMDDLERVWVGVVHMAASLAIFKAIGITPTLPFLYAPDLSELSVPTTLATARRKWAYVIASSIAFALAEEAKRLLVCQMVKVWRARMGRGEKAPRQFVIRGRALSKEVRPSNEDCLICCGFGEGSSEAPLVDVDSLQGICTAAPSKHLVHIPCYLRWQKEHLRLRTHMATLEIHAAHASPDNLRLARQILSSAGLGHLLPSVARSSDISWQLLPPSPAPPAPSLTLLDPAFRDANDPIATMRTLIPPCPGCRSAVELHFHEAVEEVDKAGTSWRRLFTKAVKDLKTDATSLITGRTVATRIATQISFLLALVAVLRPRGQRAVLA